VTGEIEGRSMSETSGARAGCRDRAATIAAPLASAACVALAGLVAVAAAAVPGPAHAYGQMEILGILFDGIRSRDPAIQRAVVSLRRRGLLEARFRTLPPLARIAETPEVLEALSLLKARRILPDAQLTPKALSGYLGHVAALAHEESRERAAQPADAAANRRTILSMGRTVRATPFYVWVESQKAYILGGVAPARARMELTYSRPDGFVQVLFPAIKRGFIHARHLERTPVARAGSRQDPAGVEVLCEEPIRIWRADHGGARLWIARLDLDPAWNLTLEPFVTSAFNRARPGDTRVEPILDVAVRNGALAAVNGTFFINSSGPSRGTPLAPIIIDGMPVWSHDERRVLAMRRAYVAVTDRNRLVLGETSLSAGSILLSDRRGELAPDQMNGEHIRHLLGGLGWLVRDGDAEAWRDAAGRQFGYSYYSHFVHRPQTVLAVSPSGRRAWLVVQEGRPHSERPLPLPELARYVSANLAARWAVFLDGGGSSEMIVDGRIVTRTENDAPRRKNSSMLLVKGEREGEGERE
jgi:hypothetical protein